MMLLVRVVFYYQGYGRLDQFILSKGKLNLGLYDANMTIVTLSWHVWFDLVKCVGGASVSGGLVCQED